jgi:Na+/H+-translocating membrane pyrophosphatase
MIPFAFAAMTMKSVGEAAMAMVLEVQRQFDEKPHLLDANPTERPDYDACIAISTQASLKEMIPPGAMVIFTPLLTGVLFGVTAVSGLLVGALVASVQLAISMSNAGGAWDNAKKYIEKATPDSELQGKGSDIHKAAVVGDTVGDPFKDTSGTYAFSINIFNARSRLVVCQSLTLLLLNFKINFCRPGSQYCHEIDGCLVSGLCRHVLCYQRWKRSLARIIDATCS